MFVLGLVIDDSSVVLQTVASHTDNSRGVIYDRSIFIVQAIDVCTMLVFQVSMIFLG